MRTHDRRTVSGLSGNVSVRRWLTIGALAGSLALVTASVALAGLSSGALPAAGFTYTSVTDNTVNMGGTGIHLKTKDSVNVKTTYTRIAVDSNFAFGWHFHNGPVIVTVTAGTLTYYDSECRTFDLSAGHSYIESTGQVINAVVLPSKNTGNATVEWFTTRLYPVGEADPAPVAAPCTP
jgi:hypothetical protein